LQLGPSFFASLNRSIESTWATTIGWSRSPMAWDPSSTWTRLALLAPCINAKSPLGLS